MHNANDLYFIPILLRAFEKPDIAAGLKEALLDIRRLGASPEFAAGYRQFEEMVTSGLDTIEPESSYEVMHTILFALATDTFDGPEDVTAQLREQITRNPALSTMYNRICDEIAEAAGESPLAFELVRDHVLIRSVTLTDTSRDTRIAGIIPGQHELRLANGRVLWEGTVTPHDVLWNVAFPGENFAMAAETGDEDQKITRVETLLDGELTLSFHPGLESGVLVISLKEPPRL